MYRIAIVEDDPQMRSDLQGHLARYARERQLTFQVAPFGDARSFVDAHGSFDLVLMDIDMPGTNGMDAAALLRAYDAETPLVFVTNLAQYALRGYEVDALDFIVKPVSYRALCQRMQKIMRVLQRNVRHDITLETRAGVRVVASRDILYVEVAGHDLAYHVMGPHDQVETLALRRTMKVAEAELEPLNTFVRVSNSHLVNMGFIQNIDKDVVRLTTGEEIWFSRPRKREAMTTIARYLGKSV